MFKKFLLAATAMLVITNVWALNAVDCNAGLGSLSTYLVNDFSIANPGYKIVKANLPQGYDWGGALNIPNNNRAITSLYCIDADQFFTIEAKNNPNQQCTLYADTEVGTNNIEHYDEQDATLKCTVIPTSVTTATKDKYSILYSKYQIIVQPKQ